MSESFKAGNKKGKGGARPNSGPKDTLFKQECARLVSSPKFFRWAERVFDGESVAPHVSEGEVIYTEATVGERAHLWEKLAAYGFGKPAQFIDLPEGTASRMVLIFPA